MKVKSHSRVQLFATPWTVAYQAPQFTGFSRQEYWSGLPFPSPGHLPGARVEPECLSSPALPGGFFATVPPSLPVTPYMLSENHCTNTNTHISYVHLYLHLIHPSLYTGCLPRWPRSHRQKHGQSPPHLSVFLPSQLVRSRCDEPPTWKVEVSEKR